MSGLFAYGHQRPILVLFVLLHCQILHYNIEEKESNKSYIPLLDPSLRCGCLCGSEEGRQANRMLLRFLLPIDHLEATKDLLQAVCE